MPGSNEVSLLDAGEAGSVLWFCTRQSVSLSVSLSVCNHSISRLLHYFFLLFGMKLGYHKGTKLTSPDFLGKFEFGQKWPKTAKNSPKMRFLVFFSKLLHLLDPGEAGKGPMVLPLSVSKSVGKSVTLFSENWLLLLILDQNLKSSGSYKIASVRQSRLRP